VLVLTITLQAKVDRPHGNSQWWWMFLRLDAGTESTEACHLASAHFIGWGRYLWAWRTL
jgi:hypothetical protein